MTKIIKEQEIHGLILTISPHLSKIKYIELISKFKLSNTYKYLPIKPTFTHEIIGLPDGDWFSQITFLCDDSFLKQWEGKRAIMKTHTWFKNIITKPEKLYIVRLYDGFDNEWIDVSEKVSKEEADQIWNEKTKNGTEKTRYNDIDYYRIYPV